MVHQELGEPDFQIPPHVGEEGQRALTQQGDSLLIEARLSGLAGGRSCVSRARPVSVMKWWR
jgi:hypothetical protein